MSDNTVQPLRYISAFLRTGVALILFMPLAVTLHAQVSGVQFSEVDKIFEEWNRPDSPGCSIAIFKDGRIIYSRGYGMANLDYSMPNTPNTVFRIGSTSKQFTAASVLLLHEKGDISLDSDIRTYLPEMPQYEWPVTVRHLVHHISGVRDYLTLQALAGVDDEANYSKESVLELLSRQKELNFRPGDEYLYSNSGYFLLGMIVERVTGKTLAQFAKETIFDPLGMVNTHYHEDNSVIVESRAAGYSRSADGFRINDTINEITGDGAVFTTVEDLCKWGREFYDHTLFGADFYNKLQETAVLSDGTKLNYAFGLNVGIYKGVKKVNHSGSFVGFRADMARFPDQHFSVVCLANLSNTNPGSLINSVADLFLNDVLIEEDEPAERRRSERSGDAPPETVPELSIRQLDEYTGDYYSEELLVTYGVLRDDSILKVKLSNQPFSRECSPVNEDIFRLAGTRIVFGRDSEGMIEGFTIQAGRVKNIYFNKIN
ncbi:serine hydrolase domain-containing protein [candidate division KSB1 bacterium]